MPTFELPDIFFVRHGETDWNAEGRYQGRRDIPLNERGRAQADANGPLLRDLLQRDGFAPEVLDWFASPLTRTRETMQRIRAAFTNDVPEPVFDERLIEISFGVLEGALATDHSSSIVQTGERDAGFWTFRPEEGENYDDLAGRIERFFAAVTKPSVVVAHGGVARVFRHLLAGASREQVVNWQPPQNAVLHFAGGRMTVYESEIAA